MNSVDFYHLNKTNTHFALCKLLEKAIGKKKNILIRTDSKETTDDIDEFLWSYDQTSFMPHSKSGDLDNHKSPICIADEVGNPNNACYLFIINTSNFSVSEICKFERTFILFCNGDEYFKGVARKLWVDIAAFDLERKYWVEDKKGWVLKTVN